MFIGDTFATAWYAFDSSGLQPGDSRAVSKAGSVTVIEERVRKCYCHCRLILQRTYSYSEPGTE